MQLSISFFECVIALGAFSLFTYMKSVDDPEGTKSWFSDKINFGWVYENSVNEDGTKTKKLSLIKKIKGE